MTINRDAAVAFARKFWNRPTDDGKFWTSNEPFSVAGKRKEMKAPESEGWEAVFVPDDKGGEDAVFRRRVDGKFEFKDRPIAGFAILDDCTHYVSRCLIAEGVKLTETPRANELTEAMLKSPATRALAVQVNQAEGQKVVDSGLFKPGDMVGYFNGKKNRYSHTAMFVGRQIGGDDDPGGITCHSTCRFQGQPGSSDDSWFLGSHDDFTFTLIHFADDDAAPSADTLGWLPGWWKLGSEFYLVHKDGRAICTLSAPAKADQVPVALAKGDWFDSGKEVVFVWRRPRGEIRVERWTKPAAAGGVATVALSALIRVFAQRVQVGAESPPHPHHRPAQAPSRTRRR